MPPSPLVRISPGRDIKVENHKRGRSLESGILYSEKDDDLALFNEVQNKERENFLLQSNDDFDDIFSTKSRYFSDYKLGISIPPRGESSDLLNVEGDKNDYDWLITPPETPLFASLDDETPANNLASRGRPKSQPISISRSSTMEKGYGSSRGSPSPRRLSPSPRSSNTTLQSRNRPFSATHSSPPPTLRSSSPSRKLSPPPSKKAPRPRSNTPTFHRMSTSSSNSTTPSKARGISPVKTSRGNSASPKIRAWQANIPGFSTEVPPNLRTSLADRPASYVRGSSPASSRNGSKSGRQSMSPTASRSVSSTHSNEKEPFSSHRKGSIASSADEDVDSLLSGPVSSSDRSVTRSAGGYPSNRASGSFKKSTKVLSSSAPKRSFDMALRQMERKGPQNMFRPMLSSVPSSTIYVGKGSYLTSRNSSITTSSNASSEQGTNGAIDIEESGQNQDEVSSGFYKGQERIMHDEVFVLDQVDTLNEEDEYKMEEDSSAREQDEFDDPSSVIPQTVVYGHNSHLDTVRAIYASDTVDKTYEDPNVDGDSDKELCSICGSMFPLGELEREGDLLLCTECTISSGDITVNIPGLKVMVDEDTLIGPEHDSLEDIDQSASIPESVQLTSIGESGEDLNNLFTKGQQLYVEPSQDITVSSSIEEADMTFSSQKVINKTVEKNTNHQQLQLSGNSSNSNDISEGSGSSLLLKRSNSRKGYIVQSRSLTTSNISYDDMSYVGDSINSMRSSMGYSSASLSSSIDLGSSKQMETRMNRQSSGHKSDMENYRHETLAKHRRSISSLSSASGHGLNAASTDKELGEATSVDPHELSLASEYAESESTCPDLENNAIIRTATENSIFIQSGDASVEPVLNIEEVVLQENCETLPNNSCNTIKEDTSSASLQSSTHGQDLCTEKVCDAENPQANCLNAISEVEIENADIETQSDADSIDSKRCTNDTHEFPSVVDDGVITPTVEDARLDVHSIYEESTVVFEDINGKKSKSLTLEEATDAILFCRSIVHDLAYEAADIAIEKESPKRDVLLPTSTFIGKSKFDRRETRSRTTGKRNSKSQKARQRKLDTDAKPPVNESDVKSAPRMVMDPNRDDIVKPMKLESKCNCIIM